MHIKKEMNESNKNVACFTLYQILKAASKQRTNNNIYAPDHARLSMILITQRERNDTKINSLLTNDFLFLVILDVR
jgi:hypothetical protein